jgi:hypothetical protein
MIMGNLTVFSFLIPLIAFIMVIILYFYAIKSVISKVAYKKFIFILLALAFLLNLVWEMLQMPLYKGMQINVRSALVCGLAAIADAIMSLLLYFGFAFIYKNSYWIENINWQRFIALILAGGVGSALMEIRHLNAGTWVYTKSMPVIPVINVGLIPVLQFMILPGIIYMVTLKIFKVKIKSKKL